MVTGRMTTRAVFHVKHRNRAVAVLAALATVTMLPGAVGVASADDVPRYRTADGATTVTGKASTADAQELKPGLHTDAIKRGERKYYAVTLDAKQNAYFSVVAAPMPGTKVEDYKDKLTISVQDSNGSTCGPQALPSFNGGGMAYPIADYASRRIGADRTECQKAGPYYLVVSRGGSATSGPDTWPIELNYLDEPPLKGTTPAQPGQGTWSTATPAPRTGTTKRTAKGGTGFNDAGSVATGVWKDRIRPGETRFYRVPVDWGQRLNLSAELPNSSSAASAFVADVLGLGVYNPARGAVGADNFVSYAGKPAAAQTFTAPVDYGNRFNSTDSVSAMRFPGWYYLEVSLHPNAAQYFPKGAELTLRVDVLGAAKAGPSYAEPTSVFSVTPEDQEAAHKGQTAQEAAKSGNLMTVAYVGIGAGVVLLAGLGAWTLVARRSAAGAAGGPGAQPSLPNQATQPNQLTQPTQPGGSHQQFGPPKGW